LIAPAVQIERGLGVNSLRLSDDSEVGSSLFG
jgi:hypothetical protein